MNILFYNLYEFIKKSEKVTMSTTKVTDSLTEEQRDYIKTITSYIECSIHCALKETNVEGYKDLAKALVSQWEICEKHSIPTNNNDPILINFIAEYAPKK